MKKYGPNKWSATVDHKKLINNHKLMLFALIKTLQFFQDKYQSAFEVTA